MELKKYFEFFYSNKWQKKVILYKLVVINDNLSLTAKKMFQIMEQFMREFWNFHFLAIQLIPYKCIFTTKKNKKYTSNFVWNSFLGYFWEAIHWIDWKNWRISSRNIHSLCSIVFWTRINHLFWIARGNKKFGKNMNFFRNFVW